VRRLAHLSDLHFGRTDQAVVDGLAEALRAERPDLIVISGDFTQRARRSEFAAAKAFVDQLEAPVFAVPGNHDIPAYQLLQRFLDPYARYRQWIGPELEPVWRDDHLGIVGVNTARRAALELNWSHGRVGRGQLRRTVERLEALPRDLFRIVVAHHPFMPPPDLPATRLVARAEQALAAFAKAGVGLVLSGHLHLTYSRRPVLESAVAQDGFAGTGGDGGGPLVVQAASATSTRLRGEPNAYNWITIAEGRVTVEVRAWDGERLFAVTAAARRPDGVAAEKAA
jgi:3',5'-cyclic AMP phosphodiesterase CpdA